MSEEIKQENLRDTCLCLGGPRSGVKIPGKSARLEVLLKVTNVPIGFETITYRKTRVGNSLYWVPDDQDELTTLKILVMFYQAEIEC